MSLLADTYPDDKERSKAMGLALSGIALGVLSKWKCSNILPKDSSLVLLDKDLDSLTLAQAFGKGN